MVAGSFHTSKKFFQKFRNEIKGKVSNPRKKIKKNAAKKIAFAKYNAAAEIDALMRFLGRLSRLF